jgi:hypothetical protein
VEQTMPLSLILDEDVPVMQDYSYALRSLDDGNGKVGDLSDMVSTMVEQLRFLANMLTLGDTNPDDTTTPIAS